MIFHLNSSRHSGLCSGTLVEVTIDFLVLSQIYRGQRPAADAALLRVGLRNLKSQFQSYVDMRWRFLMIRQYVR